MPSRFFFYTICCIPFVFILCQSPAQAQQLRVEALEERIAQLELRVAALEMKLIQPEARSIQASEKWKNRSLWRRLQDGMSRDEVESLLGEPRRIDGGYLTCWYYSPQEYHSIVNLREGKVTGWTEPK